MKKEFVFIGLGRMGLAMATLLSEKGFTVHAYNRSPEPRKEAEAVGIKTYDSPVEAIKALPSGAKTVWLMVTSSAVDAVIAEVVPALEAGDTIIDGGNSFFKDSNRRCQELTAQSIHFIDAGVSGGMEGARHGASVMVGGEKESVAAHAHIFTALATENGYAHVGGPGAGHFVKMVHNGIEYGMMGALAEGLNTLHNPPEGITVDVMAALNPYENGSIITSRLMSWLADSYRTEGYLEAIAGEVPKGETEGEMEYLEADHEMPVMVAALNQRRNTRIHPSHIGTLISAMRNQFGGHKTIAKKDQE